MKKFLTLGAAVFALLTVAPYSHAQLTVGGTTSISLNSNFTPLTSTETAGVLGAAYWNVLPVWYIGNGLNNGTNDSDSLTNLVDSTGKAQSGVDATLISGGGYGYSDSFNSTSDPGDNRLMGCGALDWNGVPSITLTLSGLDPSENYSVYAYFYDNSSSAASISLGITTYYFNKISSLSSYVEATATSATGAPGADYAEFTDVAGSSSLALTLTGGSWVSLSGVELVATPVPEPATIWSAALGFLGLLGIQRKRLFKS